jgi:hypothetical protein
MRVVIKAVGQRIDNDSVLDAIRVTETAVFDAHMDLSAIGIEFGVGGIIHPEGFRRIILIPSAIVGGRLGKIDRDPGFVTGTFDL